MKTNLIKFIDNETEFLTGTDLLTLFDFDQLNESGQEAYLSEKESRKNEDVILGKSRERNPIDATKEPFVAVYLMGDGSSKRLIALADRTSKHLLINTPKLFCYEGIRSWKLCEGENKNAVKSHLDGYIIHPIEQALDSFEQMKNRLTKELIHQHSTELLKQTTRDWEDETLLKDIQFNYVMNRELTPVENLNFSIIGECNNSPFKYYEHQPAMLLAQYLDRMTIRRLMEADFLKTITNTNYTMEGYANQLHYALKFQEVYQQNKTAIEENQALNRYKEILECVSTAGKTIIINGAKIKNIRGYDVQIINDIYLGQYQERVYLKDVETIKFGKKVLYNCPKGGLQ